MTARPHFIGLYFRWTWRIWAWTAVSLGLSIAAVEAISRVTPDVGMLPGLLFLLVWLAAFSVPWVFLVLALAASLRTERREATLATIMTSYLSFILVYAGLYYAMTPIGDYNEVVVAYHYYQAAPALSRGTIERRTATERAFSGDLPALYRQLQEFAEPYTGDESEPVEVEKLWRLTKAPLDSLLVFEPENRWPAFGSYLYFSGITMLTVGYGDIAPAQWYSRLVAIVEGLTGVALLILALGILLARWHQRPSRSGTD